MPENGVKRVQLHISFCGVLHCHMHRRQCKTPWGVPDLLRDAGGCNREQEVLQVILVQLEHEAGHGEGVFAAVPVQDVEELLDAAGREAWLRVCPVDGECLAGACLAVGKDADIVAIHCGLHQMLGVLKHLQATTRLLIGE